MLGDDPAWADRAAASPPGARSRRVPHRGRATGATPPAEPDGGDAGLVPSPTCPAAAAVAPPSPCAASPGSRSSSLPSRTSAAAARASTTSPNPRLPGSSVTARRPTCSPPAGRCTQRQPRLPRSGRNGASAGREPAARPASDRDRRCLDPEHRGGGPAPLGPPLSLRLRRRVGDVDREVANEGHRPDSDRGPGHDATAVGVAACPAEQRTAAREDRVRPDQNASTATRPRIDSVSAVAPAASRSRPRGTTHPNTTATATAMTAQMTRNSLLPCSSGPAQYLPPQAPSRVRSRRSQPVRSRVPRWFCSCRHSLVRGLEECRPTAPGCRRRRALSVVTLGGDLRVAPESDAVRRRLAYGSTHARAPPRP